MSSIEPNVGKILIEIEKEDSKTAGGIIIPGSVDMGGVKKGRVVAVGPTRLVDGNPTALVLSVGDRVVLDPLGGVKIKVDGTELLLMRAEDVLGRIN